MLDLNQLYCKLAKRLQHEKRPIKPVRSVARPSPPKPLDSTLQYDPRRQTTTTIEGPQLRTTELIAYSNGSQSGVRGPPGGKTIGVWGTGVIGTVL